MQETPGFYRLLHGWISDHPDIRYRTETRPSLPAHVWCHHLDSRYAMHVSPVKGQ